MNIQEQLEKIEGELSNEFNFEVIFGKNSKAEQSLKSFLHTSINKALREQAEMPMGVSQWMELGKKFGYDKFFLGKQAEQMLKEMKELGYESKVTSTKTHSIPHNCLEYQTCLSECKEVVKKFI